MRCWRRLVEFETDELQEWDILIPMAPVDRWLWRQGYVTGALTYLENRMPSLTNHQPPLPDELVADLTLGFWRHLTDSAHEKTLWVPYLHHAWPKKTARATVDHTIGKITQVRNRIAHHEPLYAVSQSKNGIVALQLDMIALLKMLLPDLAAYVMQTSTVASVFVAKPTV